MKMHKYTAEDTLKQIRYMCELWQRDCFEGVSQWPRDRKHWFGHTDKADMDIFVDCVLKMTKATGKTDRFVEAIMDKELHLNG